MIALPTPEARAALIERVKALLLTPKDEWPKIAAEPATIASLYSNYVIYLAAIPPLSLLIGSLVFGYGVGGITYRPSFFGALANAILQYGLQLGGVYVLALIIAWLAPRFGGDSDRVSAFKLAAYSATASWLAGIFSLVPMLGILGLLGLYSLYLLYTGAPVLMRVPAERAGRFLLALIAIGFAIGLVVALIMAAIMPSRGTVDVEESGGTISLPGGVTLDMDKLDKASKRLERMANQAEQNAAGGDPASDDSAKVRAIATDNLKALLPASLPAGFNRTDVSTSSAGAAGFDFGNATAVYAKGDASITLSLTDMGPIGALAALGGAFGANASEESETSYSKIGQVDGRMTMEEFNRETNAGKYAVMVGDRIMVAADGTGATVDELKSAVGAIDLGKAEALAQTE
jgi:Yip1 domain